jgi:hypothetical protein
MNQRMKKTALILALLTCFVNYYGFAGGGKEPNKPQNADTDQSAEILKSIDQKITDINVEITKTNVEIANANKEINITNKEIEKINKEIEKMRDINPQFIQGDYLKDPFKVDGYPPEGNKIIVTPNIVEFILLQKDGKANDLKFYLSKPFTLKIQEQNENAGIDIENNMIVLGPVNPTDEKTPVKFTNDSEGLLIEIPEPDKGSELKIHFQKENRTLVFKRDRPRNCYILFSVIINAKKPYKIEHSEVIQLLVSGKDNREAEVKVAAIDFEHPAPKQQEPNYQIYQTSQNVKVSYSADRYITSIPSRNIIDGGSLSPESVIKLVGKRKHSALSKNDIAVISEYFKEAEYEGVNVDIAIAQMLYVTDFLKKNMSSNNYAGLRNLPPKFSGSFSSMTTGVRAHIQHLKAYANVTPRRQIVDPRYKLAFERGFRGMNFDQLYRYWSDKPYYGPSIDKILCDLYEY